MVNLSSEAKVGLFVLLGISLLVFMSLRLGGIQFGRAEGYTVYVSFPSAAGLDPQASVSIAGVEVGSVKNIVLEDNKAKLVLQIADGVEIGKDFSAVLKTKGLLGEKYLELIPGKPGSPMLSEGDSITRIVSFTDVDKLITILSDVAMDMKGVSTSLNAVIGGEAGETSIRRIVNNIEDLTYRLNTMADRNDDRFDRIMKNVDEFAEVLNDDGKYMVTSMRGVVDHLDSALTSIEEAVNGLLADNRENFSEGIENLLKASEKLESTITSMGSVANKIDQGEGTVARLINDPTIHDNMNKTLEGINNYIDASERFRIFLGFKGEYMADASETKGYFTLKVQPRPDKYYLLEIIEDPQGYRTRDTKDVVTNGVPETIEITNVSDDLLFSVQVAKRLRNVVVRGGLIESTGGAGVDLFLARDGIKLSLDAFDFDGGSNPHLKATGTINFAQNFYLTAGYDNFISKEDLDSLFVGLGFTFEDDDIKYLFSSIPAGSL